MGPKQAASFERAAAQPHIAARWQQHMQQQVPHVPPLAGAGRCYHPYNAAFSPKQQSNQWPRGEFLETCSVPISQHCQGAQVIGGGQYAHTFIPHLHSTTSSYNAPFAGHTTHEHRYSPSGFSVDLIKCTRPLSHSSKHLIDQLPYPIRPKYRCHRL